MVGQVGVEGHAVALGELVALAVDAQHDAAGLHERGLAAAGLVHRRVAGAAGARVRRQHVARELGALAGQRRGEDLGAVAGGGVAVAGPALAGADDRDLAALVEAQQLRQAQVQPLGDPLGDGERRARLAALDLAEHRRAHAAALGEVAQAELHRVAQGADAPADRVGMLDRRRHTLVRYHVQALRGGSVGGSPRDVAVRQAATCLGGARSRGGRGRVAGGQSLCVLGCALALGGCLAATTRTMPAAR